MEEQVKHAFDHERFDCYRLAVEVNQWFSRAGFPRGRSHLRDQGLRASDSVVCNIAEGCSKRGTVIGKSHLLTALGSAGECCAVLDCASVAGGAAQQNKLRRIGAMLFKMSH
jgi:four helix bundle protein